MKKFLKVTGLIILILFIALVTTPFLFKGKIKAWVQNDIDKMLNADLYFSDVDLSFIRNFPDARISINDFGVIGQTPFAGDTLAAGKSFNLVVDIMSVISGNEIGLKKIILDQPLIHAIVLEDGRANWDIMAADSTAVVAEETAPADTGNIHINLQEYRLNDARIIYDDATLPMRAEIIGLNHRGSGNFTLDIYDLATTTTTERFTVIYDGIKYLNRIKLDADVNMKIDMEKDLRIDLQNNRIAINDLEIGLEGWLAMPGDNIDMDMAYKAQNTSFKSILSLVPGVYTESFGDLKTDGTLAFDGGVKGTYNETQLPGFFVNLNVDNAMVQYPDVPKPITGINMDMKVNNEDGDLENTIIDIKSLHADFGSNPIDAKMWIKGLENIQVDGHIKADLNLAEVMAIYPVEGTDLSGKFKLDATAKGTYSEAKGTFPKVNALMDMSEGFVKNAEYPAELSKLNFHAELINEDGSLEKTVFDIPNFSFNLDGEPIEGKAHVENFDNPTYKMSATGSLDLEKLMQVYPIDSMDLKGKIIVDHFATSGKYSDIETENYGNLLSSGTVEIQNLEYTDYYLPHAVTVESGKATFTPSKLELSNTQGKLGSSDYQVSGYFNNYMAYALMDNQILEGRMQLNSKKMDLNEWMEEEDATATTSTETSGEESELEVFPVPNNLDIIFDANIDQVIYDDLTLNNLSGVLEVVNEEVDMEDLSFGLLGSQIAMNGIYNTQNIDKPAYNFYLDVQNLGIQKAFESFETMQSFAPVLKAVEGLANGEFGISGILQKNMMPILEDVNSLGIFQMQSGKLTGSNLMNALADKTKMESLRTVDLGNVKGNFKIENGFLEVSPIDLKIGNVNFTIGGRQSLKGELDYSVNIDAPSGTLGQSAFTALSNLSGGNMKTSDRVTVNLLVGGTSQKPSISGGEGGTGSEVKDQITDAAEDKLNDKLGTDINLEKDSLKAQVNDATQQVKDSLKNVADQAKKALQDSIKNALANEAKDQIKDGVKDDLKGTLDDIKNKFGLPKLKKKKKKN